MEWYNQWKVRLYISVQLNKFEERTIAFWSLILFILKCSSIIHSSSPFPLNPHHLPPKKKKVPSCPTPPHPVFRHPNYRGILGKSEQQNKALQISSLKNTICDYADSRTCHAGCKGQSFLSLHKPAQKQNSSQSCLTGLCAPWLRLDVLFLMMGWVLIKEKPL